MTLRGHILNGQVVLDEPANVPDGTEVRVEIAPTPADSAPTKQHASVWDLFEEVAGSAGPGLPSDLSANHDHYAHGAPKRKP